MGTQNEPLIIKTLRQMIAEDNDNGEAWIDGETGAYVGSGPQFESDTCFCPPKGHAISLIAIWNLVPDTIKRDMASLPPAAICLLLVQKGMLLVLDRGGPDVVPMIERMVKSMRKSSQEASPVPMWAAQNSISDLISGSLDIVEEKLAEAKAKVEAPRGKPTPPPWMRN